MGQRHLIGKPGVYWLFGQAGSGKSIVPSFITWLSNVKQARLAESSKPARFLVVIDALDETDGQGGSEFLRDLFDVINKHRLPGLKFFVTSRSDPDLVSRVGSFEDRHSYRLEEVPIDETQADIMTYLNANLPHFAGDDTAQLVTLAAGLFIYAATVVKHLGRHTPGGQRKLLKELLANSKSTKHVLCKYRAVRQTCLINHTSKLSWTDLMVSKGTSYRTQ
jgi:hypothetical protein